MNKQLDLHGIKHEDVERIVIRFIESKWNSNEEVIFITGDSSKMKNIVCNILQEYKLDYLEDINKIKTVLE